MQKSDGIVECFANKDPITNATLETILFHYGCCFIGTLRIVVGYTLFFFFGAFSYVLFESMRQLKVVESPTTN